MDEFEEMRQMGEATDLIGDTPPEPETVTVEAVETPVVETPVETPAAAPPAEDPGEQGGTTTQEGELDPTIEELLGLTGPTRTEEQVKQDGGKSEPEGADEATGAPSSTDARFKELTDDKNRLQEQNDFLMRKALEGQGTPEENGQPAGEELDSEILEWMEPYVEKLTGKTVAELQADLAPIKEKQYDQQLGEFISTKVDGFKPEDVAVLRTTLAGMSEEEKAFYGKDLPGSVLLARDLADRGAFGKPKKTNSRTSPLAARHHTESTDATPAVSEDLSEEEKADRIMRMDPETIRRHVESLESY